MVQHESDYRENQWKSLVNNGVDFFPRAESLYESIKNCQKCSLSQHRQKVVVFKELENEQYPYFAIFDYPTVDMDSSQNIPIQEDLESDKNYQIIYRLFEKLGIMSQVYMTFAVKCHPLKSLERNHIQICSQYLLKEAQRVKAKAFLCFGERAYLSLGMSLDPLDRENLYKNLLFQKNEFKVLGEDKTCYVFPSVHELLEFPQWRHNVWAESLNLIKIIGK